MTLPLRVRAHQTINDNVYEFVFEGMTFYSIATGAAIPSLNIAANTDTWILTQPPTQTLTAALSSASLTVGHFTTGGSFVAAATAIMNAFGGAPYNSQGGTPGHYVSPPVVPAVDWNAGSSQSARQFVRSAVPGTNGLSYDLGITVTSAGNDMRVVWTVQDVNGPPQQLSFGPGLVSAPFPAVDPGMSGHPGTWSAPFEYIR